MTYEQFDKATQIHVDMNVIYTLQDVIGGAKNGKYLAAIAEDAKDLYGIEAEIDGYKLLNKAKVPTHIMEKFEKILWEELDILKTEFNKL